MGSEDVLALGAGWSVGLTTLGLLGFFTKVKAFECACNSVKGGRRWRYYYFGRSCAMTAVCHWDIHA